MLEGATFPKPAMFYRIIKRNFTSHYVWKNSSIKK